MELEMYELAIEREPLKVRSVAAAEGELTVPASLPQAAKLLNVNARAYASGTPGEGRAAVDGCVVISVIYACAEGNIYAFDSTAAFKHSVELDVASDTPLELICTVGAIESSLTSAGIFVRAVVEISCTAQKRCTLPVVRSILAPGVQSRENEIKSEIVQIESRQFSLDEDVRLMRLAKNVLGVSGFARVTSVMLESGCVVIEGTLRCMVAFETPEGSIAQIPAAFRFTERVELEKLPQRAFADVLPVSMTAQLATDETAAVSCTLETTLKCVYDKTTYTLSDAYSTQSCLTLQNAAVESVRRLPAAFRLEQRFVAEVPVSLPPVDRALVCSLRCQIEEATPFRSEVRLRGCVYAHITYLCVNGKLHGFACKLPFESVGECSGSDSEMSANIFADCELTHVGSGRQLQLQLNLDCFGEFSAVQESSVVTDVCEQVREVSTGGVTVYYPAASESLWDIGKRFGITQEQLARLNPELAEGKPLIINLRRGA